MLSSPYLLPIGVGALVASIFGVQLGNSTISAIKPEFFLGPAVHPRDRGVAVDPREIEARRLARLQSAYDSLYGWDEGNRSLRLACIDCGDSGLRRHAAVFDYDARVPYFGSRDQRAVDEAGERLAADRQRQAQLNGLDEPGTDPAETAVSRYADYPVTEDDVSAAKPEAPRSHDPSVSAEPPA